MPTTTNFGWTTPADTDLVSQGAAAMRTLGNGIDSSLVDLKGGTAGQILAKATGTDLDFSWITNGWTQLATSALSGTTVSFTGISGSYDDLRVVLTGVTFAGAFRPTFRFGTAAIDTGSNYRANYVQIGTAAWTGGTATTSLGGAKTQSSFPLVVLDVSEYARTNTGKMARMEANATDTAPEYIIGTWLGGAIQRIDVIGTGSFTGGTATIFGRH